MINSTRFSKALIALLVLCSISLQSCIRDNCDMTFTYAHFTPQYMTASEFRSSVEVLSPQTIVSPGKIYVMDHVLLVNEIGKGIHVIDNKNPENPQPLSFLRVPGNYDIAFNCDKMYLDSSTDLLVFDMNDPSQPRLINRLENALPHITEYQGFKADPSKGIVVAWEKEIKTEPYNCETGVPALWKMNEVNPSSVDPTDNNTRTINPAVSGKAGSMSRFTVLNDFLHIILPQELITYNAVDCENPVKVGSQGLDIQTGVAEMISTMDNLLLVGATNGVSIFDASNADIPQFTSRYNHVQACDPVVGQNGYLYVTLRNGEDEPCGNNFANQLDVIDLKNPYSPFLIESFNMSNPKGLGLDADMLFLADGRAGLKIFDNSVPEKVGKKLIAHFPEMDGYDVIAYDGTLILVGNDGIAQYSYDDPKEIKLLSTITVE